MLQQHITPNAPAGTIEPTGQPAVDRSMDVLQYGLAVLAIVVAALLATFH